jgi:predicted RND superfamily exporter protein
MASLQESILNFALNRPKLVIVAAVLITIVLGALILRVDVDTDPENMLRSSDPVRVLNQSIKADFGARDVIVLGIVDEGGVLNSETLTRTARLVDEIKALDGVVPTGVGSFTMAGDIPGGETS